MLRRWFVRLDVARDDNGSLSDEGMAALTDLLAKEGVDPAVTRGEAGTVLVRMTLQARDDNAARSAAERVLRDAAAQVWSALGLPPFTIAFIESTQERREPD